MQDVFIDNVWHFGSIKKIYNGIENLRLALMFRTESDHKLSEIFISQYAVLKKRIHSLGNAVNDPVRSEFLLDDVFAGDAVHHRDDDGIFRDQTFDALQSTFQSGPF